MAAIHDLIAQVEDRALRQRLEEEVTRLIKGKKFGLVFEGHLPELTPLYFAKVTKDAMVARRGGLLTDLWRVLSVVDSHARCIHRASGREQDLEISDHVVVRQVGEPIFPSLVPVDRVANAPADAPWHTLIEADNYHALQLLEYLYAGQVDCIYIDPPYNTGARDWKYNNDYVDSNDSWRHSKWLAMMRRRLRLAKRLLNPRNGVLIVTIDEHEVHHLRMLLEETIPEAFLQMVTVVINPKGVTQGRFSRVEEYLFFCFLGEAGVKGGDDDFLTPLKNSVRPRWKGLLRSGTNARRVDRKNMFYPVLIDEQRCAVIGTGEPLPFKETPDLDAKIDGYSTAWPVRTDGSLGNWGVGHETLRKLIAKGYVAAGRFDSKRKTFGITYLSQQLQRQIETGGLAIAGHDKQRNVVDVVYAESAARRIKTVWHRTAHDAGAYGADILSEVLGRSRAFSFPKSLYAVRDTLACVTREKKDALVLDFFAGSGTTLHALNLLNATDGGRRRCILVTNNEVSEEEERRLTAQGHRPGEPYWEQHGICQSVTWPRMKYTILGRRDDGTVLEGDYLTGNTSKKEKERRFFQISFIEPAMLNTAAKKKQVVALLDSLPQSAVKRDTHFIVLPDYKASILFDEAAVEEWLAALEDQDHLIDFYIVTSKKPVFDDFKARIVDLLGPMLVTEDGKRPMREGFAVNLEYFRLDFLNKDQVALKRRFREILPILWLRAGAVGPRPDLPKSSRDLDWLVPKRSRFGVLLNEHRFGAFLTAIADRADLTHVFLVTDSEDAFQEMAAQIKAPVTIQLYRDYLENFMINKGDVA